MKLSTLDEEAHRGYNFPTLTQNLVSLPVLADNGRTIKLHRTIINVTKGNRQVMEGYKDKQVRL